MPAPVIHFRCTNERCGRENDILCTTKGTVCGHCGRPVKDLRKEQTK